MLRAEDCALVFMAGGHSRRFGPADKLEAGLNGLPLALVAADRFQGFDWGRRIAVVQSPALKSGLQERGFFCLGPASPAAGIGDNIAAAIAQAQTQAEGAEAALIALADMPNITPDLIQRLLQALDGPVSIALSRFAGTGSPPALFHKRHFPALSRLTGDVGAMPVVKAHRSQTAFVTAGAGELQDIDTPDALDALGSRQGTLGKGQAR